MVNLWQREAKFMHVLNTMMKRGVKVDTDFCRRKLAIGDVEMANAVRNMGGRKPTPTNLKVMLLDELELPVLKWTDGGSSGLKKPSFDKIALGLYEEEYLANLDNPLAKNILTYRGWQKTCSTNYAAYLKLISPDGRLRCNYKLHGTKTSRLSCEAPNLQNVPKLEDDDSKKPWNYDVKHGFVAEDEFTLVEVDFSQLEFRLAAAYANQQNLIEIFNDPARDVFTEMSTALGYPRQAIKVKVYAGNYGAQPPKIASILGIPVAEAHALFSVYNAEYPNMFKLADNVNDRARYRKHITYWSGRRRHFPNAYESRKAFNSLLQGGGAEIVKSAMIRVYNEVDGPDCKMLLQVHDSIVCEVRTSRLDEYIERITDAMSRVTDDKGFYASQVLERVLFPVQAKVWGA
jgi:DNA polymerase-1